MDFFIRAGANRRLTPLQELKASTLLFLLQKPQLNIFYEAIYVIFWKRQNYRERKHNRSCQGLWVKGRRETEKGRMNLWGTGNYSIA